MKIRDIIKIIEQDGWFMVRIKGSHRQFKHNTKNGMVTIAEHLTDELARGMFNSIFKQAGLKHGRKKVFNYPVIIEKTENNYSAYSPDLPGCVSTGITLKETLSRMRNAIQFHVKGLKKEGLDIPEPSTKVEYIEISI